MRGPIALLIGLGESARALTQTSLTDLAVRGSKQAASAPLGRAAPKIVIDELRFQRGALEFEEAAEGKRQTPPWFVTHAIGFCYATYFVDTSGLILAEAEKTYRPEIDSLPGERETYGLDSVQLGLECCHKLRYHLTNFISPAVARLGENQREFGGKPWPSLDEKNLSERLDALEDRLVENLAEIAPALSGEAPRAGAPDDLGYAYAVLADRSLPLMLDESPLLKHVFASFLIVALKSFNRLAAELALFPAQTTNVLTADVILDLFELSGHAFMISETIGGPAWVIVRTAWEVYITNLANPSETMRALAACVRYRRGQYLASPSDTRRIRWKQQFEHRMRQAGFLGNDWGYPRDPSVEAVDPVVRTLLSGGLSYSASDAFISTFLIPRADAAGVQWPRSTTQFASAVTREATKARKPATADHS